MAQRDPNRQNAVRTLLIVLVGQVGCLTLLIIMLSVVAGQWLDAYFHTRPVLTLVLLFAGIPISVLLMLTIARRTLKRLAEDGELKGKETQ